MNIDSQNILTQDKLITLVNSLDSVQYRQLYDVLITFKNANSTDKSKLTTISNFKHDYFQYVSNTFSDKYLTSVKTTFNHLTKHFGNDFFLADITIREAELFKAYLIKNSPRGILVYLRNLKAAYNRAIDWGMITTNPFLKIKIKKQQCNRPAIIDERELEKIATADNEKDFADMYRFSFYTGARLGETITMKWEHVDFENKLITIGDEDFETKSRQQRIIPIRYKLLKVLEGRAHSKKSKGKYVFPKSNGTTFTGSYISKRFKRAVRKVGMDESIHYHSLRHSFGSELGMKGISITIIKDLMGHSSVSVTEKYSHTNLSSLQSAIKKLDESDM